MKKYRLAVCQPFETLTIFKQKPIPPIFGVNDTHQTWGLSIFLQTVSHTFHRNSGQLLISTLMPNSKSWSAPARPGASVRRQAPFWVLGKAMTSLIELSPAKIATRRSKPMATPPWGGAPKVRASSKNPNFSEASSSEMDRALKTLRCTFRTCGYGWSRRPPRCR